MYIFQEVQKHICYTLMIPDCKLSSAGKEFITDISKLNSNGDQTRQVTLNLLCMVVYVVRWDENELMAQDF